MINFLKLNVTANHIRPPSLGNPVAFFWFNSRAKKARSQGPAREGRMGRQKKEKSPQQVANSRANRNAKKRAHYAEEDFWGEASIATTPPRSTTKPTHWAAESMTTRSCRSDVHTQSKEGTNYWPTIDHSPEIQLHSRD